MNLENRKSKNMPRACLKVSMVFGIGVALWMYFRVKRVTSLANMLPFLLLLACPMTILMMRGGGGSKRTAKIGDWAAPSDASEL